MTATIHERPFKNKPAVRRRLVVPALALTAALALGLGFAQQLIGSSLSASLAVQTVCHSGAGSPDARQPGCRAEHFGGPMSVLSGHHFTQRGG